MSEPILPLLRAYAAERRRTLTGHPTPEELLDYHLGEGTPEQREGIQDHLALCPDCTRAVLDFAAFPDIVPEEGGGHPPDAAAWTRLRERTFAAAPAAVRQPRAYRRRVKALSLIAASLLVASLGGYYMGSLGSTPEGQVFTHELVDEGVERSAGAPEEILVPGWAADGFVLRLLPEDPQGFSRFEAELFRLRGKPWHQSDLSLDPNGQVAFYVPRDVGSGPVAVQLYGIGRGERTLIMQKPIDLQWPDQRD